MTRRFKNGSKQGIILVMVLLILAMAMIFISAAILLTNGTRNRLYDNAEKSQARLTATSTAEAIWQAVYMQELNYHALHPVHWMQVCHSTQNALHGQMRFYIMSWPLQSLSAWQSL